MSQFNVQNQEAQHIQSNISAANISAIQNRSMNESFSSNLQSTLIEYIKQLTQPILGKQKFYDPSIPQAYQKYTSIIGVLQCIWQTKNYKMRRCKYATGFAINPRTVITCTHNVYSSEYDKFATIIHFCPNLNPKDDVNFGKKAYVAKIIDKKKFPDLKFACQPFKESLTVLYLLQELLPNPDTVYPDLGNLNLLTEQNCNYKIVTMGYPSNHLYVQKQLHFDDNKFKLCYSQGKVCSLKQLQLNYTIQTTVGFDGSPLFIQKQNGETLVIGIHTHNRRYRSMAVQKTINYDSGLYFRSDILGLIDKRVKKIGFIAGTAYSVQYNQDQQTLLFELENQDQLQDILQNRQAKNQEVNKGSEKQIIASKTPNQQKNQLSIQRMQKQTAQTTERIKQMYSMFEQAYPLLVDRKQDYEVKDNCLEQNFPFLSIKLKLPFQKSEVHALKEKKSQQKMSKVIDQP